MQAICNVVMSEIECMQYYVCIASADAKSLNAIVDMILGVDENHSIHISYVLG